MLLNPDDKNINRSESNQNIIKDFLNHIRVKEGENSNVNSELLIEAHKSDFLKSGINDETLNIYSQAGYLESIENGWRLYYPELTENAKSEYWTIRNDEQYNEPDSSFQPDKQKSKYKRPAGETSRIFRPLNLNPAILEDTTQPIIFTEGEKKALKAVQEGFSCLSIAGVWCFKSKHTDDALIPDLHKIKWDGRKVYLCFDNDIVVKPQVKQALYSFMEILSSFGAIVRPLYLPSFNKVNKKLGLDDYLIEYGAEHFQKVIDIARIPVSLLLDRFVTKKNEDFGKKIEYDIEDDYINDFKFVKNGIYAINDNYYDIYIIRPKNDDDNINWKFTAIKKSNFVLKIQREVKNHSLKFDYQTEHKVEIITKLNEQSTKPKIITAKELLDFKNSHDVLKTNGIHLHTLTEYEYKNVIHKELEKRPTILNSFENPGFNILNNSNIWITQNLCVDLNIKEQYLLDKNGYINYKGEEIVLKTNKGFQSPIIKIFDDSETTETLFSNYEYLKEVKDKYKSHIDGDYTLVLLIASALFDNVYESYGHTIEPFLILGTAVLSPFVEEIYEKLQGYPIGFAGGESQSGKSNLLINIAHLFGFKQNFLKSGNDTVKNLLHNIECYSKIPVLIQETGDKLRNNIEDMLIKPVYDRTGRGLMSTGEEQNIKAVNSTLILASNDIIHRNLQTSSRLVYTDWKKENFDKNIAKRFNPIRENLLSAILPSILVIEPDEILELLEANIKAIEQQNFNIDTRSISNIALARTGMDILISFTGLREDVSSILALQENYTQFLEDYCDAVSIKDSFDIFIEIFEILLRDDKITYNTDWKVLNSDTQLAIYLKSVYPRFSEYFKRMNDNGLSIPTEKNIGNSAKKRGFNTNYNVKFNTDQKKCLTIDLSGYEHLKSVIAEKIGN